MRGRHHFELTESGRTGPSGVGLVSDLIYGGRLRSASMGKRQDKSVLLNNLMKNRMLSLWVLYAAGCWYGNCKGSLLG